MREVVTATSNPSMQEVLDNSPKTVRAFSGYENCLKDEIRYSNRNTHNFVIDEEAWFIVRDEHNAQYLNRVKLGCGIDCTPMVMVPYMESEDGTFLFMLEYANRNVAKCKENRQLVGRKKAVLMSQEDYRSLRNEVEETEIA